MSLSPLYSSMPLSLWGISLKSFSKRISTQKHSHFFRSISFSLLLPCGDLAPQACTQSISPCLFLYIFIILIVLLPSILISKKLFSDKKEQVIFSITGFVGNTGNIGIPLGIALFGQESVIYTTLINLANVFVVYMLGVYIYSRGSFDVKTSLLNIIKIPIIPASIIAIILNVNSIEYGKQIEEFLKMGAYSGIVMQLFLLGAFLQGVKLTKINLRLLLGVFSQKFILLPLLSIVILNLTPLSSFAKAVIFMEMMMPLAISNINLASLYDCRPKDITALILLSTLLFLPLLFVLNTIINMLYL